MMDNNILTHIRSQQRKTVLSAFGVQETKPIQKSVSQDFNVYEEEDIQKSDIMQAVSNCDNPITMKKSGKEVKEQIQTVVLPDLRAHLENKEDEINGLLMECGAAPTCDIDPWWTGGIKMNSIPFYVYDWNETCFRDAQPTIMSTLSVYDQEDKVTKLKANIPDSREQAEARCKYNNEVHNYCEIFADVKTCEILLKNIKDNDSLNLTARQIMAFRF